MSKSKDEALKQIVRGAGIVFIGLVLSSLIGFFFRLVVARSFGPDEYGKLTLAMTLVSLGTAISVIGLDAGLQRYLAYFIAKKNKRKILGTIKSSFVISFIISLFVSALAFIFSEQIASNFFHNVELAPLFRIFSLVIPFNAALALIKSIFLSFKKAEYKVFVESFGEQLLKLILTLIVIYVGGTISGVSIAYLAVICLVAVSSFLILQLKVFKVFNSNTKPVYNYKLLLVFSFPLLLSRIFSLVMGWSDTFLLGYFKNETYVGLYNVALPLAGALIIFFTAFGSLFYPIITELYAKKKINEVKKVYSVILKWIFLVTFPAFMLMVLFPTEIIRILFGSEYLEAAGVLVILAIGYFVHAIIGPALLGLQTLKKTKYIFYITFSMAILNIFLNILLIPILGLMGAAIATTTTLIITHLSIFFKFYSIVNFKIPFKYYLKYVLSTAIPLVSIFFIIKFFFSPSTPLVLAIALFIYLVMNAFLLLLFKSFSEEDFMIMKAIEKRFGLNLAFFRKIISKFL